MLDYNVEFKTPAQVDYFYAPGPYRSSDHDPVIVGLGLHPSFARVCELTREYVTKDGIAKRCARSSRPRNGPTLAVTRTPRPGPWART